MQEMLIGEYIRSERKRLGLSQEELCRGICNISTLSRLERGKQSPGRDTVRALLHRLGLPGEQFIALVSKNELEIGALKTDISAALVEYEHADQETSPQLRERIMAGLARLEELIAEDDVVNRQYILSAKVSLGSLDGSCTPSQRKQMLMEAVRMSVPGFQLSRLEQFLYRQLELKLLIKLARTLSLEGKRAEAINLYSRLLRLIEDRYMGVEGYPGLFCWAAYNCAIQLATAKEYQKALDLAERGRQASVRYGNYYELPGFLAIQAECQFFLGQREKSAGLYIRAGVLYDVLGNQRDLEIIRKEARERLELELPV